MANFKIFKETALPGSLQAHSIYVVAPPGSEDYAEIYITNNDGTKARRVIKESDVQALIANSLASVGQLAVVADISARDNISNPASGAEVFVIDATGDSTVSAGSARYIRHNGQWLKTAETESMDLALTWATLQDKPSSTVADIDQAVAQRHTHANMTQLNKISEDDDGNLTYGGSPVATAWTSTGW